MKELSKYDVIVVGAGLFGCTVATVLSKKYNKKVLVCEEANEIGGACRTHMISGIMCHMDGAHIFRTNDEKIVDFVKMFCKVKRFSNRPIADTGSRFVRLPFCIGTVYDLFGYEGAKNPKKTILDDCVDIEEPKNLEEYCLKHVGRTIYENVIKGYTEKQWQRDCKDLDVSVINELPIRLSWDNDYFDEKHQFVPVDGYSDMMARMLSGVDVMLNTKIVEKDLEDFDGIVVYSGRIDEFYGYKYGELEYRSLDIRHETFEHNQLGNAVMNYPDLNVPYVRKVEHKYFYDNAPKDGVSVVSTEIPCEYIRGVNKSYYPVPNARNMAMYALYEREANMGNVIFGGRLGQYKYNTMEGTIKSALEIAERIG